MFYQRNLQRKHLVLCTFTYPSGHGYTLNSGVMISVNNLKEITSEFERVTKGFKFRDAKLTQYIPESNNIFAKK